MIFKYEITSVSRELKVYELQNGERIGYVWKVDDLKNNYDSTSFLKKEESMDSFSRSQRWLKENYPEYFI
jgi:hypothetical protein